VTAGELTIASRPRASLASRLAMTGWLASVAMAAIAFVIQVSTGNAWIPDAYGFPGFTSVFGLSFATVGAIVVSRRPANVVGRVLLITGLLASFQSLYTEYAIAAYVGSAGHLPFAEIAAWLVSWAWVPSVLLIGPFLLSIFPDGRLLSPRWAMVPILAAVDGALFMVLSALEKGPINNFAILENPFGLIPSAAARSLAAPLALGLAMAFILPAWSLVLRYRRSDSDRRHQLKWIAVAAVVLAISAPLGFGIGKPGQLLFILSIGGIPIATGIAVLRYRLYDIDTIINRALVYGLLTAIIAGIYTASIGVMQRLSHAFLGGDSEATIVVTTVLVVTAFTPIKTRLQALVDRRFKDAGDAKSTLEPFTKALHERTWAVEPLLVVRRFAEVLVPALGAARVEVGLEGRGAPTVVGTATSDALPGGLWSTASTVGLVTLRLSATLGAHGITPRDEDAVTQALTAVAAELAPE